MNKKTFGQIIRELRWKKGMTKRDICGDEKELSIRQLTRLERGQSKPTLTKIRYLAEQLKVSSYLLMEDYQELPQDYLNLKYRVLRMAGFGDEKYLQLKDSYLEKIYECYLVTPFDSMREELFNSHIWSRFLYVYIGKYDYLATGCGNSWACCFTMSF
ncbi:helix-turn-helix domain-containing protein [Streptococcus himalayensis]|uniref:ComR tetratricopeptide domain-containing protein n=1 Tax=Streptococcus himalayensis TaxID=1888195 RepID=A0A917A8I5_9STRE|nr:helix-turn-helix transcriptional regulator [Streptococcus himalayensis]GGE34096.1 hypothetical protein GCM10011510_14350 [Streptococcus himalayensis]